MSGYGKSLVFSAYGFGHPVASSGKRVNIARMLIKRAIFSHPKLDDAMTKPRFWRCCCKSMVPKYIRVVISTEAGGKLYFRLAQALP